MKNILIFYTPIIEVIDQYTKIVDSIIRDNKNDNIYIVKCNGYSNLKNCISNYNGDKFKCLVCKSKLEILIKQHRNIKVINYPKLKTVSKNTFQDIQDLIELNYRGINIGVGIHSAVMTVLKDHKYDIVTNLELIDSIIHTSKLTLDFLFYNQKKNFKKVFIFNGRVSHFNAVVEYCKKHNIDYNTFEIVTDPLKYLLVNNAIPHNKSIYSTELNRHWRNSKDKNKIEIGKLFFSRVSQKKLSKKSNFIDYSSFQKDGVVPNKLKKLDKIISIFGSSRNEYESVEGWINNFLSGDDEEIIREICNYFPDYNFVYRAHPNLKLSENTQTQSIQNLNNISNLTLIESSSRISSYELIKYSEKIIVFGSTVGVEATYMDKPVICIGPSLYEDLDITYKPKDLEELKVLFETKNLQPKSKNDAIKFGYFELTKGIKLNDESKNLKLNLYFLKKLEIFILKLFKIVSMLNYQLVLKYLYSFRDVRIRKKLIDYFKV